MEDKYNGAKGLKRAGLMFVTYIKNLIYDFFVSFKYNNMKLPGLLVAVPGILIGFFLKFHIPVVKSLSFTYSYFDEVNFDIVESSAIPGGFDWSAISIFVVMLAGLLNIFTAAAMMSKKNLGSVVLATITTAIIIIAGGFYLASIFICYDAVAVKQLFELASGDWVWDVNKIISITSISVSMLSAVVGLILGYIFYDRTYEKVNR